MPVLEQRILVADEAWIATALLHREHPDRVDFTISEIVERARREDPDHQQRPGLRTHVTQHCVANRVPNPGAYRMLTATGKHTRRLFRPGDPQHPRRKGKILPERDQIPEKYHKLLDWYENSYAKSATSPLPGEDPILALSGAGRAIRRSDEHPDDSVRALREGWQ